MFKKDFFDILVVHNNSGFDVWACEIFVEPAK
jgi:hypothetical protein